MSNAIEELENAGEAVKNGADNLGATIEKEFGGKAPQHTESAPDTPDDCGPVGCQIEEEPAQA